jgi:hypothetical protein
MDRRGRVAALAVVGLDGGVAEMLELMMDGFLVNPAARSMSASSPVKRGDSSLCGSAASDRTRYTPAIA